MDQELYDEFGNYIGPDMDDSEEEGSEDEEEEEDDEEEREQQGPAGPEVSILSCVGTGFFFVFQDG